MRKKEKKWVGEKDKESKSRALKWDMNYDKLGNE